MSYTRKTRYKHIKYLGFFGDAVEVGESFKTGIRGGVLLLRIRSSFPKLFFFGLRADDETAGTHSFFLKKTIHDLFL